MAVRSLGASSPISNNPSTNNRKPRSVGTRPALVWGAYSKPIVSRSDMMLRMDAGDRVNGRRCDNVREPTGQPFDFRGDVASVAKRDLRAGEMLDGEGGYTVWGKLMPAAASLKAGALPIGLAHRVKLKNDVAHGAVVRWSDVEIDADNETIKTRRAMEARFGAASS